MNLTVVNPIKLAEDIAMLDHFTGGRVFVGFSRGNTPRWTATFGQHIDVMSTKSDRSEADTRNRAVFYQNWEIVKRLWTQETVQLQDGVWKVPKSVPWEFYPTRDFRHRRRRGREPDPGGDRAAPATTAPPAPVCPIQLQHGNGQVLGARGREDGVAGPQGQGRLSKVLSSSAGEWQTWPMKSDTPSYHGYRFPPEIISHAVWLYHRFCVSFRDVEDLLAQRGITVSYEAIRLWCIQFGSEYARRLKRRQGRLGDTWHLDEVFVTIQGQRHYLWRAVDQDGDVIDILVQSRRDRRAAKRFIRKLLKGQGSKPGWLVTDKLRSYRAAHREVMPSVVYSTERYGNNRAEVSHQPTRQRERQMRRFKSPGQAQRFLSVHGLVRNLFHVGRHLLRAEHHRELRGRSFLIWDAVTIAA